MGITDAIKDSVMESFNTTLSTTDIILGLLVSLIAGLFILLVYRSAMRQISANRSFCITLMLVCSISAMVVLTITSNLALSLGMVGALSIVRFRTAVKDPLDTAYMFWSLTMGILVGAGQFFLAAVTAVGIAGLSFLLKFITSKPAETFLLVVRGESGVENDVSGLLRRIKNCRMKSKTLSGAGVELTYEIRLERQQDALINKILSLPGIQDATLVSYANETL